MITCKDNKNATHKLIEDSDFVVKQYSQDNITVDTSSVTKQVDITLDTGYTHLAILTTSLENATSSGTNYSGVFVYHQSISGNTAHVMLRNTLAGDAKVKVTVTVLSKKN